MDQGWAVECLDVEVVPGALLLEWTVREGKPESQVGC